MRDIRYWLAGLTVLMLALLGIPVLLGVERACFSNYDLGIYGQALALLSPSDPNPFLSVRQVLLFRDHVDPILWLGVPLARLMDPAKAGILVELGCAALSAWPVVWLVKRGVITREAGILAVALLLFNPGLVRAVHYPFHPTTWAVLPMALLCAGILGRHEAMTIAGALLLMACKEEFPAAVLVMGITLLRERRRTGIVLVVSALVVLVVDFVIRPRLMGGMVDYTARYRTDAAEDPVGFLAARITDPRALKLVGSHLAVLAPLIFWCLRERIRPTWSLLLGVAPLLAVRMLGWQWGHHYVAVVMVPLVMGLLPRDGRVPRYVQGLTLVALLAANVSLVDLGLKPFCPGDDGRMARMAAARAMLLAHPDGAVLAQTNLVPLLITRPEVYQLGGEVPRTPVEFHYVLVERPPHGDPWPLTYERIAELMELWRRTPGAEILVDDELLFLARGSFLVDR